MTPDEPPARHERAVAGIPMRWEEQGVGMPVVLVHGIPIPI